MNLKNNLKAFLNGIRKKLSRQKKLRSIEWKQLNKSFGIAKSKKSGISYYLPYASNWAIDPRQINILHNGFHRHLERKYFIPDCSILECETIIDVGAFVGGFSVAMSLQGIQKIISIEPSPINRRCLKENLRLWGCEAFVEGCALGAKNGKFPLHLSESGCDDSFLVPDNNTGTGETVEVECRRLDFIIDSYKIKAENLGLKVEAEGFEPEVLLGLGNIRPAIIVVDVTPERNGRSPREEIREIFIQMDYRNIYDTERCIFCKLLNDD